MNRDTIDWSGPMPAVTTPFNVDMSVDEESFVANVKRLFDAGATGIVGAGCTTIPAQPGADAGDFHRDIGEGLFGESFDLQLPDYYFNALIPLDPGQPAIGFSASVSVPSTQCVQHARSRC